MIRIPQVRVVDEEGAQLGVMATPEALAMAQERGYDLVEVAPMASPPVVKFLDFGQYKYELTKRDKENKRRQRSVTFKEVRLTPKIGSGDFETKVHRAIEFLEDGDRIKVTVRFRGRELTHPELGRNMLTRFTERIKEHGTPERAPLLEGKSMHLTVASLHKPKEHEPQQRHGKVGHTDESGLSEDAPVAAEATSPEPTPVAAKATSPEPTPVAAKATSPEPTPVAAKATSPESPPAATNGEEAPAQAPVAPAEAPAAAAPAPRPQPAKASQTRPADKTTEPAQAATGE
jgi:translation initiation factor IF-3